jgi:hypothetical protein
MGVPYTLRVDNNVWTMTTLIKTATVVNPDLPFEACFGDLLFESLVNILRVAVEHGAVRARSANKNVFFKGLDEFIIDPRAIMSGLVAFLHQLSCAGD